ncbi:hypothetical protein MAV3388_03665 [Mycobacterium avium subsp. hominissuis 3388]|nr:hypothetical protein MAV3388_03665 [Mycobacterium avium subsp. hominissuis 3388]
MPVAHIAAFRCREQIPPDQIRGGRPFNGELRQLGETRSQCPQRNRRAVGATVQFDCHPSGVVDEQRLQLGSVCIIEIESVSQAHEGVFRADQRRIQVVLGDEHLVHPRSRPLLIRRCIGASQRLQRGDDRVEGLQRNFAHHRGIRQHRLVEPLNLPAVSGRGVAEVPPQQVLDTAHVRLIRARRHHSPLPQLFQPNLHDPGVQIGAAVT